MRNDISYLRADAQCSFKTIFCVGILPVRVKEDAEPNLHVGVEFASPSALPHDAFVTDAAPKGLASRVAAKCFEKGMLLLTTSIYETVRFIPPLNVSKEEMAEGCGIFREAVEDVVKEG